MRQYFNIPRCGTVALVVRVQIGFLQHPQCVRTIAAALVALLHIHRQAIAPRTRSWSNCFSKRSRRSSSCFVLAVQAHH